MQKIQLKLESLLRENRVGKKLTNGLEIAKLYAISRNGLCHSTEYINADSKLEWSCGNKEHVHWEASYSKVVNGGRWCPQCAKDKLGIYYKNKEGLKIAQEHAQNKGGECLSKEYVNARDKLEWKCHNPKHTVWFAPFKRVVTSGTWCPECGKNRNIQESRVRNILNEIFNTEFISCKLNWNINPETGRMLELDGYSESLAIAFEYQGEQHFLTSNINSQEDLEYLQRRDQYKKENCKNSSVKLIIVNYIKNGNNFEDLLKEIKRAIEEAGVIYNTTNKEKLKLKLKLIFNLTVGNEFQEKQLLNAKLYAFTQGGSCLSTKYINVSSILEWKCNNINHASFHSSYKNIIYNKKWCSKCYKDFKKKYILSKVKSNNHRRNSKGLLMAQAYAKLKGGQCFSTEYINNKTKLEWKCSNNNHKSWKSSYDTVVNGEKWCPYCKGAKSSEKQKNPNGLFLAKNHAKSKGGECLSNEYKNIKTKLEWKCGNLSHSSFHKTYEHVISRNQWCPECYKERKNTL